MRTLRAATAGAALAALLLGASAVALAADASGAASAATGTSAQQQALARYSAYAGAPVAYFRWLGYLYKWQPLGKDRLAVFTTANEAYLLTIWPPCDLSFAVHSIGFSSRGKSVYARSDAVIVDGRRCVIGEIRKVDYARMKADADKQAAAAGPPGAAEPGASPK